MTESEAIEKLRAYHKCQRLQVKGIYEDCNEKLCDNCDLCYAQGNAGEHIKSIEIAIQALEEVQKYRAIGTPEECQLAVEKQKAEKVIDDLPTDDDAWHRCPTCEGDLTNIIGFYCTYCGQKLDWSDEE